VSLRAIRADVLESAGGLNAHERARRLDAARHRTAFVGRLRWSLALVLLILGSQVMIQIASRDGGPTRDALVAPTGEGERIVNPRFTGRDESGAPYVVTADAALRRYDARSPATDLERPRLDYDLIARGEESGSRVLAESGTYDAESRTLFLDSDVRFRTRSGWAFETASALLDLSKGSIIGEEPVSGASPWGRIRAGAFEVRDRGDHIIFRGEVRTRLNVDEAPGQVDETGNEPQPGAADGPEEENAP
jgi:lipopolysaccharide export system protein LptC